MVKLLKNKTDKYENIRLIISCREEYRQDIFGEFSDYSNDFEAFRHNGFLDNSIQALHEFCNFYKIKIPSTPLLSPELSNPLILKTLCEAFQQKGQFPKGINGVSNIFQAYLEYLNNEWRDKRNQLTHSLFNKDPNTVIIELKNMVEKGYTAVRILDNAVTQLKKEKIRDRFKIQ